MLYFALHKLNFKTMKKIIYILLLSIVTVISVTSCQKEEVKPSTDLGGGGLVIDPK
jgi:hypothetical protein